MQPLTRQDGTLITENKGIAEKLNRFFARVYTDKNTENIWIKQSKIEEELITVTITTESVRKKLSGLRPDSTAGPDNRHP